jgi:Zn-dependent protease
MNSLRSLDGVFWLLFALVALIFLQRILHREIQAFFLILTRNPGVTQVIFALIFFPGVFLHELSHFIMAKLLGVRTGSLSLIPKPMPNGRLRLGYVETASGGVVRDSLVGLALVLFYFRGQFHNDAIRLRPACLAASGSFCGVADHSCDPGRRWSVDAGTSCSFN